MSELLLPGFDVPDGVRVWSSGAGFSRCNRYRYWLKRQWGEMFPPMVNFIMLNPSTADASKDDPTVRGCIQRARSWGYGGLIVTNLFAWRATDPSDLPKVEEPIGDGNDDEIIRQAERARLIVCAWGTKGGLNGRNAAVLQMLRSRGFDLHFLRLTKAGHPEHPLYIPQAQPVTLWEPAQ